MKDIVEFLASMSNRGYSPRTVQTHRINLLHFGFFMKRNFHKNVIEASKDEVQMYFLELKKTMSQNTQYNRYMSIKHMYLYFVKQEKIVKSPADSCWRPHPAPKFLKDIPSENEIKEFLSRTQTHTIYGLRDHATFETIYSSALRNAEARNLDESDVHLEKRIVTIRNGKGGKDRLVPLGRKAVESLRIYLAVGRPKLLKNPAETALFISDRGHRVSKHMLWYTMNKYKTKKVYTPHQLRKGCALGMLRHGASLKHIQDILGHEWMSTTLIYTKLDPRDLKEVHKKYHPREDVKPPKEILTFLSKENRLSINVPPVQTPRKIEPKKVFPNRFPIPRPFNGRNGHGYSGYKNGHN